MKRRILCMAETRVGHGTGHIRRCLEILTAIGDDDSGIYVPEIDNRISELIPQQYQIIKPEGKYDFVVLDKRRITADCMKQLSSFGMTIGLDAQGPGRRMCDYLIDMLPQITSKIEPNLRQAGFLAQPKNRRAALPKHIDTILLAFGGEDSLQLSSAMARVLVEKLSIQPERISVLIGKAFSHQNYPDGVTCIRNCSNAKEIFANFDLVIGQFGLSLFEASVAGCAVAAFHPSWYHKRLADAAGFFSIGVRWVNKRRLHRFLRPGADISPLFLQENAQAQNLADFLLRLVPQGQLGSPLDGSKQNFAISRCAQESFFRCQQTGLIYKQRYAPFTIEYTSDYFGQEYRQQYGKTYLQDFEKIQAMGMRRMAEIQKIHPRAGKILDIGCAYGPFLQAAKDAAWQAFGIDISPAAVEHVQKNLKLPAIVADATDFDIYQAFSVKKMDVISMWYVIEHIADFDRLMRHINRSLEMGGVFAFSTPNGSGISARKNLNSFLCSGPQDHVLIFSAETVGKIFARYGFRLEKIVVTGHHPERFPYLGKSRLGRFIAALISKLLGLGDTFEAYFSKTGDAPL